MMTSTIDRVTSKPLPTGQALALRCFDFSLALTSAMLALPLFLLALPGSRRKPLALRGRNGRIFQRSVLVPSQGARGRLLQRLGLNGYPILLNILRGDMAWVGPRPVAPDESVPAWLEEAREQVRPGLFSLWWLRSRTNIDYESEWHCDAEQLAERSLMSELGILARSLLAALYGSNQGAHDTTPGLVDTVRVHPLSMSETLDAIERHRSEASASFLQLCFVNPDCVNIARRNARYRKVLNQAGLVVPDGIGMRLAGKLLKRGFRQNVNGTDLFPRLCQRLAGTEARVFLLGGQPGVAEQTADWIRTHHPELRIAGTRHGYFDAAEQADVIKEIRASRADVLLVAMGAPRQELWIQEHAESCGVRVAMGVGGLFDFYAGRIPRAPQWLREIGLEWTYRLYQEPGRMWRRYLIGNLTFLTAVLMQRWVGSIDLAQMNAVHSLPPQAPAATRAVLLMNLPESDDWMAGDDDGPALFPLGDRPLLYRSLETLAGLGCREVTIFASHGLARIRAEVGPGERWGLTVTIEAVRNFNDARRRIGRLQLAQDELIWLARADHWLPAGALRGADRDAVWVFLDNMQHLQWTGWARMTGPGRAELLAALEPAGLALHRLPEHLDRIGASEPLRFDQGKAILAAQERWLHRDTDQYEMLNEAAPGIRIAPSARVARGARLSAPLEIGENTIVGRQACIGPNVVVGRDCRIEGEVEISDSLIADGVELRGPASLQQVIATRAGLFNTRFDAWLPAAATGDLLGATQPDRPVQRIGVMERLCALALLLLGAAPVLALRTVGRGGDFSRRVYTRLSLVIRGRLALVGVGDDQPLPASIGQAGWQAPLSAAPQGLIRPRDALGISNSEAAAWADVHWLVLANWRERRRLLRAYFARGRG